MQNYRNRARHREACVWGRRCARRELSASAPDGWRPCCDARSFRLRLCGLRGFLGAIATIYRYLVRPIARAVTATLDAVERWRVVPDDITELKELLTRYIAQNERRFEHLEPPLPYARRKTS